MATHNLEATNQSLVDLNKKISAMEQKQTVTGTSRSR